ncbi:hypothetical protein K443DRAFT_112023, partial [Laccaria amethystina LaAM-08-1]
TTVVDKQSPPIAYLAENSMNLRDFFRILFSFPKHVENTPSEVFPTSCQEQPNFWGQCSVRNLVENRIKCIIAVLETLRCPFCFRTAHWAASPVNPMR